MKRIVNKAEYEAIMARVDELVIVYEKEHYPIGKPVLTEVLKSHMYEMNITQRALAEMLGISAPRVSEYLTGKAEPTLQVARKMHKKLNIDANVILGAK